MDQQQVLERVRKLLALSSNNTNEAEATSAAQKAQALLIEHNLEVRDVFSDRQPAGFIIRSAGTTRPQIWCRRLALACSKLYLGTYYFEVVHADGRRDRHQFVGREANVIVAIQMWQYLVQTVQRLARQSADEHRWSDTTRQAFIASFHKGATKRLCARIHEMIEAAKRGEAQKADGSNLPACLDLYTSEEQAVEEFVEQMQDGGFGEADFTPSAPAKSQDGERAGMEAAKDISLNQQLDSQERETIEAEQKP